jgi:hypothetical protein
MAQLHYRSTCSLQLTASVNISPTKATNSSAATKTHPVPMKMSHSYENPIALIAMRQLIHEALEQCYSHAKCFYSDEGCDDILRTASGIRLSFDVW